MSNPSTESEFNKELVQILSSTRAFYHTAVKDGDGVSITRTNFDDYIDEEKAIAAIKQAVDKHVIGEDRDWRLAATAQQQEKAIMGNVIRNDQRRNLYSQDKSNG